jgi:hypothetical protein
MDYKRILKNKEVRFRILQLLKFIPDEIMVKIQYKIKLGRNLNLINPKRFTEKLQWYKLNYHNTLMTICADKYGVREYVKSKGLDDILIDLYSVYDNPSDINFGSLPNKFVLKTNNGNGTNIFCNNKSKLSVDEVKKNLIYWMKQDFYLLGREWAYKNIKFKIIIEEFLQDRENIFNGINDYKFFCFNGRVKFIVVDVDRYVSHKRNFYNVNWNYINVSSDYPNIGDYITKPYALSDMIKIANRLSEDFPFVRVDLYYVNKKIYFGELTFYPFTGYVQFEPDEFDFKLGREFILPPKRVN